MWQLMPIVFILKRRRQKDCCKFKASQGCKVSSGRRRGGREGRKREEGMRGGDEVGEVVHMAYSLQLRSLGSPRVL